VGLIFLGSLALVGIPLGTLWLVSHVVTSSIDGYLVALLLCPAAVVLWGSALARMESARRRMRNERAEPQAAVLDLSITVAVLIALTALIIWYVFAGATGPGPRVVI
jgi:uncharacterized membrane protein